MCVCAENRAKSFKFDVFDLEGEHHLLWKNITVILSHGNVSASLAENAELARDADIVLFNLDHHSAPFEVPEKSSPRQMFALTGHAPTSFRSTLWHNANFTSLFDMTVHWGTGADVALFFFDDEWGVNRESVDISGDRVFFFCRL